MSEIDVISCRYFYDNKYCELERNETGHLLGCCKDFDNCYYKQLQQLKQENEELKKKLEELHKKIVTHYCFADDKEKIYQLLNDMQELIEENKDE